jgi:hypothetical protein
LAELIFATVQPSVSDAAVWSDSTICRNELSRAVVSLSVLAASYLTFSKL